MAIPAAMYRVLLQRQGELAGGLLPQWLSGYAFLFSTAADLGRTRQLRSELSPAPPPLVLVYDSGDPLGRAVAERIAVNAREAGITLRVTGEARGTPATRSDARLVRVRLERLDPREALADLAASLDLTEALRLPDSATAEETYAAERGLVESFRVVGLFHLPETYGLSPRVKNWAAPRWGGWRLEDVWLDGGKP